MTASTSKTMAYLRVSTIDQDIDKNKADILTLANELALGQVHFVEEKASGKIAWRKRKIATLLDELQKGDALIVSELSRLGRSMLECMEILSIASQKEIRIYAVKGNWHLDPSIQSKIIAMAFSMAAEIERDLISKRTTEALHAKKAAGMTLGRPKGPGKSKLDNHQPEIVSLLQNGSTQRFIAKRYGTTPANLRHWLLKRGLYPFKVD
ncbi:MAG: recombinase family protein [Legionellales bacterium]|nr:recombinase family protein [Legionellales bacterium]